MKANVARFYGWTDHYIKKLGIKVFMQYFNSIEYLRNAESVISIRNQRVSQADDKVFKKEYAKISKKISPVSNQRTMTTSEAANYISEQMNGK